MTEKTSGYDIELKVDVTLETLVNECPKKGIEISYDRDMKCRVCSEYEKSPIRIKNCKACHNTHVESVRHTAKFKTTPGNIDNQGMSLVYKEHGHYCPATNKYGRLFVTYNIKKESNIYFDGKDIIKELWITPLQLRVGLKFSIWEKHYIYKKPGEFSDYSRFYALGYGGYELDDRERGTLNFVIRVKDESQHRPSEFELAVMKRIDVLEDQLKISQKKISQTSCQSADPNGKFPFGKEAAEMSSERARGVKAFIEDLLPSIDSLEKALENMRAPSDQAHREGISLILDLQQKALAKYDVYKIPAKGRKFDPYQHEAVAVNSETTMPKNLVTDVLQEGYTHAGRLIRPAMVRVSS